MLIDDGFWSRIFQAIGVGSRAGKIVPSPWLRWMSVCRECVTVIELERATERARERESNPKR